MEFNVNKNKFLLMNYRYLIVCIVLFLLAGIPVLFGELTWFSLFFFILGLGNYLRLEIARKATLFTLILMSGFIIFIFFPPFTENELILSDYSEFIRMTILFLVELVIIGFMLFLKSRYN